MKLRFLPCCLIVLSLPAVMRAGDRYAAQLKSFLGTTNIVAKGSIAAKLGLSGIAAPSNVVLGFSGTDPSGRQWTQSLTVPFAGPATTATH